MVTDNCHVAKDLFVRLSTEFDSLDMELEEDPEQVEMALRIPKQRGLDYDIQLNLQSTDELHFSVDDFWGKWFPCTDQKRVEEYFSAVKGFLAGEFRIKVFGRKGKSHKRLLQQPHGKGWKTIYTHSSLHWPFAKSEIWYVQANGRTKQGTKVRSS